MYQSLGMPNILVVVVVGFAVMLLLVCYVLSMLAVALVL